MEYIIDLWQVTRPTSVEERMLISARQSVAKTEEGLAARIGESVTAHVFIILFIMLI